MLKLLKLMFGRSEEHKAAEEEHRKRVEDLEKRDQELEDLHEKLRVMCKEQETRREELSKTAIDLSTTIKRHTSQQFPAIKLPPEDEDDERISGEHSPAAG